MLRHLSCTVGSHDHALYEKASNTLASTVSVSGGIECLAAAIYGEHAGSRKSRCCKRFEWSIDTGRKSTPVRLSKQCISCETQADQ